MNYRVKDGKALAEVALPGERSGPVRSPHEGPEDRMSRGLSREFMGWGSSPSGLYGASGI